MFFHLFIAPGQGQTTLCGQNPDVNRKALSLCPFVASFKKISLKSDFIHIFAYFYTCISSRGRERQPLGDKVLTSTESPDHFDHLLLVASFKMISFNSDFIHIFKLFYTCI